MTNKPQNLEEWLKKIILDFAVDYDTAVDIENALREVALATCDAVKLSSRGGTEEQVVEAEKNCGLYHFRDALTEQKEKMEEWLGGKK